MTPNAFRRFALSFPDAVEQPHFHRASFRMGKKIFATMTVDGAEAMIRVPSVERLQSLLETQPDVFFSYGGWTIRNGSLGVRLAAADSALVKELLTGSWRSIASKKAIKAYEAGGDAP